MCWGMPDYQEKFKSKLGYDLPNPPKTMQEMHDVASFFTGWDWNGDGKDDWGISLHAKVNEQGFFHFLTLAAPYVISPSNKYFYFNPDDMKPLINSEGHLRALEDYVKFLANGPERTNWLDAGTGLEPVFEPGTPSWSRPGAIYPRWPRTALTPACKVEWVQPLFPEQRSHSTR